MSQKREPEPEEEKRKKVLLKINLNQSLLEKPNYMILNLIVNLLKIIFKLLKITRSVSLGGGDDDDEGPSVKRAKSDSPSAMTPTPPAGMAGMPGMVPPGMIGAMPQAPFGMSG